MKVKKEPMPILQKIFYILSFIFLIAAFIYLGTKNFDTTKKLTDAERFEQEYHITKDNLFVYKNSKEILDTINSSSAIIYMAYPENEWSASYANHLNDVAKSLGIKEIYYYNFKKDKSNNNHYYEDIVTKLSSYLPSIDSISKNLYAPTLLIVKNKEILYYDDETSIIRGDVSVEDYWTKDKISNQKKELTMILREYMGE